MRCGGSRARAQRLIYASMTCANDDLDQEGLRQTGSLLCQCYGVSARQGAHKVSECLGTPTSGGPGGFNN